MNTDKPAPNKFDPAPFLLVAIIAAFVRAALLPFDLLGSALAYGVAGFSCGWVLRTRLPAARRVPVIVVCAAVFLVCGPWVESVPLGFGYYERVAYAMLSWAGAGAIIGVSYLSVGRLLAAPVLAAISFAIAGAATQAILLVDILWVLLMSDLLSFVVLVGLGGVLFDYSCLSLGLASPTHGMDRLRRLRHSAGDDER